MVQSTFCRGRNIQHWTSSFKRLWSSLLRNICQDKIETSFLHQFSSSKNIRTSMSKYLIILSHWPWVIMKTSPVMSSILWRLIKSSSFLQTKKEKTMTLKQLAMTTVFSSSKHMLQFPILTLDHCTREGKHNIVEEVDGSSNPDDSKWSYFREDLLFHVFHTLFHKLYSR